MPKLSSLKEESAVLKHETRCVSPYEDVGNSFGSEAQRIRGSDFTREKMKKMEQNSQSLAL